MPLFNLCPKCDKPIIPTASTEMKMSGQVCCCEELGGATKRLVKAPRSHGERPKASEGTVGAVATKRLRQTVTLPYPPTANNFKLPIVLPNGRVQMVLSKEAKTYKKAAEKIIVSAGLDRMEGPLCVTMDIYRPRRRGDVDNAVKLAQDALVGYAMEDDEQVQEIHLFRHEDKANPRVVVVVEAL